MSIQTRLIKIDPRKVKLLDLNARYMRHEVFQRLVDNVKQDGALTSVAFGWQLHDDNTQDPILTEDGEVIWEVLSGNHRVKAAVEAELDEIDFMITDQYLAPSQRRAIQLSHNAIAGEDDPAMLRTIYTKIDDVGLRLYAGLDDKMLELLDEVNIETLTEANLAFQTITMTFLPQEIAQVNTLWDDIRKAVAGSKGMWLARWAEYDAALDALEDASMAYGIKNTATALMIVLDIFNRHIEDLQDGYLDPEGEAVTKSRRVPLASIIGDHAVPASTASALKKAFDKMIGGGEIEAGDQHKALEMWARAYLEG